LQSAAKAVRQHLLLALRWVAGQ